MAEYIFGLGKGLKEPCSPNRSDYIFGAELNDFNADSWNCIPEIWDATIAFDLSAITKGREVAVALLGIRSTVAGEYHVNFKWYRDRDNKLLYEYTFSHTSQAGSWLYGYSYIGFVEWEINENGSHHVDVAVTGAGSYERTISFTVSGITEAEPVPELPRRFVDNIFSFVWDISALLLNASQTAAGWIWPFSLLQHPLHGLHIVSGNLLTPIAHFGDWVREITGKAASILSLEDIFGFLIGIIHFGIDAWEWIQGAWSYITNVIDVWWDSTKQVVQVWIDSAISITATVVSYLTTQVGNLQESWDNFTTQTLPKLASVIDVSNLIDSALSSWFPFYDELTSLWSEIRDFFVDPLQWLNDKIDEFFERFW